jgi:hypothetical protein
MMNYRQNSNRRTSDIVINNSYKVVNEKIIKLKKFEFDFANFSEAVKNYLIVQEIIVRNIFSADSVVNYLNFYIFRC